MLRLSESGALDSVLRGAKTEAAERQMAAGGMQAFISASDGRFFFRSGAKEERRRGWAGHERNATPFSSLAVLGQEEETSQSMPWHDASEQNRERPAGASPCVIRAVRPR